MMGMQGVHGRDGDRGSPGLPGPPGKTKLRVSEVELTVVQPDDVTLVLLHAEPKVELPPMNFSDTQRVVHFVLAEKGAIVFLEDRISGPCLPNSYYGVTLHYNNTARYLNQPLWWRTHFF